MGSLGRLGSCYVKREVSLNSAGMMCWNIGPKALTYISR